MRQLSIFLLFLALPMVCHAQKYQQQTGIVREIHYSRNAPLVPVAGVRVKISTFAVSDAQGRFAVDVPVNEGRNFRIEQVTTPNRNYALIYPKNLNALYPLSSNDLVIVVANKAAIEQERQKTEKNLRKAVREQNNKLTRERKKRDEMLNKIAQKEAEFADLQTEQADLKKLQDSLLVERERFVKERDSLQTLLRNYATNEPQIEKFILKEAEELSVIDYGVLDSLEVEKVELRKQGQWYDLLDLLRMELKGSADEVADKLVQKREELKARDEEYQQNRREYEEMEQATRQFIEERKKKEHNDNP